MKVQSLHTEDSGFTLIELLVVLVVMGILSGITYVALGSSRVTSMQNACKTAYQAISLGVSAYQSDNNGTLPPSFSSLQPTYINSGLVTSFSNKFTMQLGSYLITNEALASKIATLTFTSPYTPPITVGETIQVFGIDSVNIDGTWTVASFSGTGPSYTLTFSATSALTIPSTAINSAGGILNALTSNTGSYDVYLYDATGSRLGNTAPSACTLLK